MLPHLISLRQGIPGMVPRNSLGCPICQEIDPQLQAFLSRPLESSGYAYLCHESNVSYYY
jgi:hypothetical protein